MDTEKTSHGEDINKMENDVSYKLFADEIDDHPLKSINKRNSLTDIRLFEIDD